MTPLTPTSFAPTFDEPPRAIYTENEIGSTYLLATDTLRREPNRMQGFSFDAHIFREGEAYVAYVPALDLSSCGATDAETLRNTREAVRGFLATSADLGTLDEILRESGYESKGDSKRPRLAGYEFSAMRLRSVSGVGVETVLGVDRRLRPAHPLRAFVGHRFTPGVTNNLRHNLQLLCCPYGISLRYSDSDMPNGSIFETIVQRIRESDFCVFDDRETEVRPNVLIELGAAIGIGKPYFYLSYRKEAQGRDRAAQGGHYDRQRPCRYAVHAVHILRGRLLGTRDAVARVSR
jgi:hypothetical protein